MNLAESSQIVMLFSVSMNVIVLIMQAKMQANIAELKLYVHENFVHRRRIIPK